ncbi:MAG: adenylate/guanylate cyclase domain-containing protein [Verrucomicrobia bacterium]|nr:adenylate/guanylate cyclase domain-containing protein [Verrucomicrobiota bacterium]
MTLRKRLFLNVGLIFLGVAILSYLLPSFIVNKEMAKGGQEIENFVQLQEKRVNSILTTLLIDNFKELKGKEGENALADFLKSVARTSQKNIVFLLNNKEPFAFNSQGEQMDLALQGFNIDDLKDDIGKVTWKGVTYNYLKYPVDSEWNSTLVVLNPADQDFSIVPLLKKIGASIGHQITLNILLSILLIFIIALLFLSHTAKKITDPIVVLAKATADVEDGHYDSVALPDLEKRKDEIGTLSHGFEKMVTALRDREKIRGVLSKVVSKQIAAEILERKIELGGEVRSVTVLFSDVRGFTKITEKMEPKQVVQMMNNHFSQLCRIVDNHEGVVDKFVGDLIMVLYGAPIDKPDSGIRALTSALQMKQAAALPIGIGIHTGDMVTGNIGSENRLNYTVLGANVNLASRLCSAAGPMQILISEATLNSPGVKERFDIKELTPISLKGFEQPVKVYEVLDFKK